VKRAVADGEYRDVDGDARPALAHTSELEHPVERAFGADAYVFVERDLRREVAERVPRASSVIIFMY
jgi:hypothetical protein